MPKRQWLSEEADLFLRSGEGGRVLFWYGGEYALLMIEDPARAGIQIELTVVEDERGAVADLIANGWWEEHDR